MDLPDPYWIPPWQAPCTGRVRPPGSKSLTNRALVLGALAEGPVCLRGALFSRDSRLLVDALRELGFVIEENEPEGWIRIEGRGGAIPFAEASLRVGNAGTAARFLAALVCLRRGGQYHFDGDEEMHRRPMDGLLQALAALGARFTFHGEPGKLPFTVETNGLRPGRWQVDARASSQMLSALLMVAPLAGGEVRLRCAQVRPAFVEMTRRLMVLFGAGVEGAPRDGFRILPSRLRAPANGVYRIEADATAASYFLALPFLVGGELFLEGIPAGSLQGDLAFAEVMKECGLRVETAADGWCVRYETTTSEGGERVFDFTSFSDTFLTFAALAPFLPFPVRITGVGHTRFQECDRVAAAAAALRAMGARVRVQGDDICIGKLTTFPDGGCRVETRRDHRVAMSFALAGCRDRRGDGRPWLGVRDPACVGKTFPSFFRELDKLYRLSHDKSERQ